jgi:hypothetical protein
MPDVDGTELVDIYLHSKRHHGILQNKLQGYYHCVLLWDFLVNRKEFYIIFIFAARNQLRR